MKIIYHAILLDDKSRTELLRKFKPIHPNVKAEHVTLLFGKEAKKGLPPNLGESVALRVIAYGEDESAQGVRVKWGDRTKQIGSVKALHVTISFADGASPVKTNDIEKWIDIGGLVLHGKVAAFTSAGWVVNSN